MQGSREQVEAHLQLDGGSRRLWVCRPATAPDTGQGGREQHDGTVLHHDRRKPSQERDGDRIAGQHLDHGLLQHLFEAGSRLLRKATIQPLWADLYAQRRRHLGQIVERGLRLMEPAEHERLHQGSAGELPAPPDAAGLSRELSLAVSSGLPFPWIRHLTPQIVSISLQTTEASTEGVSQLEGETHW